MVSDLMLVILVWLVGALLQISVGSLVSIKAKEELVDGAWATGRLVAWLAIGLVVWFLAYMKIPINTTAGIWLVAGIIVIWSGLKLIPKKAVLMRLFKKQWKAILIEEVLFLFGLVFMVLVRGYNPRIFDLEKFMDMGFMNSYIQSRVLPAGDMWLSGAAINYYSFGHFLGSVMVRLWRVEMAHGYNLLLGWLMGLVLSITFSVVINLVRFRDRVSKSLSRPEIVAGLVGSVLVTFGGNGHAMWYWVTHRGFGGYWYADATRFIANTIHEFPSYSFVVSDLHAHLWGLPIVLLFIMLMIGWGKARKRKNRLVWGGLMGATMGIMVMTNTWDVLVYGMVSLIYAFMMLAAKRLRITDVMLTMMVGVIGMVAVAAPWWISFEPISQGVRWVSQRSPIHDLVVLWAVQIVLSVVAMALALSKVNKRNWLLVSMGLAAFILILIPEIVYVKDIYPNHPRANTMFKLTYQSFVLMSVIIGASVAMVKKLRAKIIIWSILAVGVFGFLSYPIQAYLGYYPETGNYLGIDGESWLREESPDDYAGILWLRNNADQGDVVLEAVGESYTRNARVSAFTGLPTVLGWRVHEWLWRGGFEIPGERTEEVRMVYEDPTSERSLAAIDKYKIKYVFIGDREREAYVNLDMEGIVRMGKVVFRQGETIVVEL